MKVLITGFEPFGGDSINPSWLVAKKIAKQKNKGVKIYVIKLSCVFDKSIKELKKAIKKIKPDIVLSLGLAAGRADITIERVAININDARINDNAGNAPIDTKIFKKAPAAYFSTLPIKAILQELKTSEIPASISNTAGTFVCNHVFFAMQHLLRDKKVKAGFIHLPYLPRQISKTAGKDIPTMPLKTQIKAINKAIKVAARNKKDIKLGAGLNH